MKIQGPWYSKIAVTEKIDGFPVEIVIGADERIGVKARDAGGYEAYVGSVSDRAETFGFPEWVRENRNDLLSVLGGGRFKGVWWGEGIGRNYGAEDRYFALLAFDLYDPDNPTDLDGTVAGMSFAPVLYYGPLNPEGGQDPVAEALRRLQFAGSALVRGFKSPAGVVVTNLEAGASFSVDL